MGPDQEHTRYYSTRPRRVPPEFCIDERLEECSPLAALALYRIISQADDQGRLPGSPKSVKAVCFPMRSEATVRKVSEAIAELVEAGFLLRYGVEGRTLIQVLRWLDLQGKAGRRAYPSRYPAPPGWDQDWINVREVTGLRAVGTPEERDLRTPIPITLTTASSSTVTPSATVTGLGSGNPIVRGPGSVDELETDLFGDVDPERWRNRPGRTSLKEGAG